MTISRYAILAKVHDILILKVCKSRDVSYVFITHGHNLHVLLDPIWIYMGRVSNSVSVCLTVYSTVYVCVSVCVSSDSFPMKETRSSSNVEREVEVTHISILRTIPNDNNHDKNESEK